MVKSPRKTRGTALVSLVTMTASLGCLLSLGAQEPPSAPTPKTKPASQIPPPPVQGTTPAKDSTSQPAAATPNSDSLVILKARVNLVVLPVTVKDSTGHLVPDLTREEFRIFDDSVEQKLSFFTVEAFPLSVVILIDNDLKGKDSQMVEESLKSIVGGLSLADEAFVCRFDTNFHPGKGFTKDQDKLVTELRRVRLDEETAAPPPAPDGPFNAGATVNGQNISGGPGPAASTKVIGSGSNKALDDAMYEVAGLLSDRGRDRRKVVILISDGQNAKNNKYSYDTVVKELLRYNISVYSLGVSRSYFDRKLNRLQSYAHDTGGDSYYAQRRNSLEELYSRVSEQARNQYTLAYSPQGNDKTKDYHQVEVRVRRAGLNIITREGYFTAQVSR